MCGRFALFSSLKKIQQTFDIQQVKFEPAPSYNVAPTQDVAVVVQRDDGNCLEKMSWGLIPFWANDPSSGSRIINARAETLNEKPTFKRPLKEQRCLVIADGFFEWRKVNGSKVPMFIRLKSERPFAFAGLFDTWTRTSGTPIISCAIVTTSPNDFIRPIHHRMPVILQEEHESAWLNSEARDADELLDLLAPYPAHEMEGYDVSRFVNSPTNNTPACIEPIQ